MANTKQLKTKVQATSNIQKITNALEIFSTIKLQKTKKDAVHIRESMVALISLLRQVDPAWELFHRDTHEKNHKTLLIVLWSDKWLCWSLNSTLFKKIHTMFEWRKDTTDLYVIWKKTKEFFTRRHYNIVWNVFLGDDVSLEKCQSVIDYTEKNIEDYSYTNIYVCYNVFKNTMKYIPVVFPLFPLHWEKLQIFLEELLAENVGWDILKNYTQSDTNSREKSTEETENAKELYETKMEPSKQAIKEVLRNMIMRYVVYWSLLQNKTCEFAARMIAMKAAKDNANEQIHTLTLAYNKARQDAITKEIIEIAWAKSIIMWQ